MWRRHPDKMAGAGAPPNRGLFRSRKRLFSCCLVILAVTFAVLVLKGQHEQGLMRRWFNAGTEYQKGKNHRVGKVTTRNKTSPGDGDSYAKARSNARDAFDEFLDSIQDLSMEGAANVDPAEDAAQTVLEGAIRADAEQSIPAEGAFNPAEGAFNPAANRPLSAKTAVDDFKSASVNKGDAVAGLNGMETNSKLVYSKQGGLDIHTERDIYRKDALYAGTKESPEMSLQEVPRIVKVPAAVPIQSRGRYYVARTTENVIPQRTTTTERVYYDLCEKCCYRYTTIDRDIIQTLNESMLEERGCQQRLPDAMIFGVKKGGTTTLRNFLSYHPDIAFTQKELKFFTSAVEASKGLEHYRSEMVYSTPRQISMEKTPAYSHYPKVPLLIRKALPDVKLIIIMRDPVQRAVSDYVHMQVTIAKRCGNSTSVTGRPSANIPADCDYKTRYDIADTFEKSVINTRGAVIASSQLISKGIYVLDIERYRNYFRPEQILALDGEAFIHDPYPAIKKVERFLGVRDYFTRDFFYFNSQKGFFCLNKPIPNNCMNSAKGRPHPVVQEEVLQKLRDFYRPYNNALRQLVGLDFNWSS